MSDMKTAVRTPNEALQSCADQSAHGPQFGFGQCQMQARLRYLVPSDGTPDAATAWANSQYKYRTTNPATAPRGAFHFWVGGSSGHGHVSLQRMLHKTFTWSTDIRRVGFYDMCPVAEIHAAWGLTYVGWSLDNDGVLCVPGAVDYLNSLLHPEKQVAKPKKIEPIPLARKVKIIHGLARKARKNGAHDWARRFTQWAEQVQLRNDSKVHKGSTAQERAAH